MEDVDDEDKEAESNENAVDNSNKWDQEYFPPSIEEAEAREAELTDSPLFKMVKASIASLDSEEVDKIAPGLASNPDNVKRVESIMTSDQWDYLFAVRDPDYTYRRHKLQLSSLLVIVIFEGFCKLSASSPLCVRPTLMAGTPRPSAGGHWPPCLPTSPRRPGATTPTGRWRSGDRAWSTSGVTTCDNAENAMHQCPGF